MFKKMFLKFQIPNLIEIHPAVLKLFYAYRRMEELSELNKRSAELCTSQKQKNATLLYYFFIPCCGVA
jgi:hypothetical protein